MRAVVLTISTSKARGEGQDESGPKLAELARVMGAEIAGVELHRYGLTDIAIKLAEKLNIPIASDLLSKSAVPENHPLYLGVYGGAMSSDQVVRDYIDRERLQPHSLASGQYQRQDSIHHPCTPGRPTCKTRNGESINRSLSAPPSSPMIIWTNWQNSMRHKEKQSGRCRDRF